MQRLLYIMPHCSTGGLPQYTLRQIQEFQNDFKISVCEVSFYGDEFVVQRNQIKAITDFHSLFGQKEKIIALIERLQPDIIHFQELPEEYLSPMICHKIFANNDRKYHIVCTTHGSNSNPEKIHFIPDRFILVCEWSQMKFQTFFKDIECGIWEYPIDKKIVNRKEARKKLQWDNKKFHVLNVGLFTPGKNQGEIFELAKRLSDVEFHFVGNMAGNFSRYWQPLMNSKPANCKVYGERPDVDTFYQAADVFYFSSLLELNPLCVKEAISYRLPVLMRRLETYLDQYDKNKLVIYIKDSGDAYKIINTLK